MDDEQYELVEYACHEGKLRHVQHPERCAGARTATAAGSGRPVARPSRFRDIRQRGITDAEQIGIDPGGHRARHPGRGRLVGARAPCVLGRVRRDESRSRCGANDHQDGVESTRTPWLHDRRGPGDDGTVESWMIEAGPARRPRSAAAWRRDSVTPRHRGARRGLPGDRRRLPRERP